MRKVVFITRHDPTKISGGAFATRAYLEALNKLYPTQVVLFVADTYEKNILKYESSKIITAPARAKPIAILGVLFGKLTRFDNVFKQWLKNNIYNIDKVVFDGSIIAGSYIDLFKKQNCELITIHHNYEVEYHKENKSIETIKGLFLFWIKKLEKKAFSNSHINLFLTKPDLNLFTIKYGGNNSKKEVIGCFEFYKDKNEVISESAIDLKNIKLVISGSLATYQTKDGVDWFLESIYPKLKEKYTNIALTITGRSPSEELMQKCGTLKVNIIPSPINIRKIIAKGDIYVCPTRLGGGLKLRIMDALALGLPCLIHEKSYRGYENIGKSKFIHEFTNADDFLFFFGLLLRNINKEKNINSNIYNEYNKEFSFEIGVLRLKRCLSS
jgi:glycosyltransferase involved in cell wall biosynthesis